MDINENTVFRCETCGKLLLLRDIRDKVCVGHRIKFAIRGTFWEWIKIKLRLYLS